MLQLSRDLAAVFSSVTSHPPWLLLQFHPIMGSIALALFPLFVIEDGVYVGWQKSFSVLDLISVVLALESALVVSSYFSTNRFGRNQPGRHNFLIFR
jgi:hypothetical protein